MRYVRLTLKTRINTPSQNKLHTITKVLSNQMQIGQLTEAASSIPEAQQLNKL
jgi:hypothetical protein